MQLAVHGNKLAVHLHCFAATYIALPLVVDFHLFVIFLLFVLSRPRPTSE